MDNVLEGMRDNLKQHQTVLGNLLQQMEDAKVEVKRPFPQEAELAEKSERLAALNVALNIGGKDKPNSRERQKHDGKTSIKRLLRRMGVESAASAAPKKDKEMLTLVFLYTLTALGFNGNDSAFIILVLAVISLVTGLIFGISGILSSRKK